MTPPNTPTNLRAKAEKLLQTDEKKMLEDVAQEIHCQTSDRPLSAFHEDYQKRVLQQARNAILAVMAHVGSYNTVIRALLEDNERMAKTLTMLSRRQIATWYKGGPTGLGYYAGWDDAEYDVKITLSAHRELMGDDHAGKEAGDGKDERIGLTE